MYAPRPSLPKASDGVPLLPAAVDISAPIEDIRASFATVLSLEAVSVAAADVQPLASSLRRLGALFDRPRLPSVLPDPESPVRRLVLLREGGLQEEALALLAARNLELRPHNLRLGYDYWPADVVLRALLPPGCEVPTAFETVGHIAHLNLRDELLPFGRLIGRVLLDKNAGRLRTVLNKVGTIDSEFRVPRFDVLAGDATLETEVRQHGAVFRLDYGCVYWNSRLEHEHARVVGLLRPGEVLCDLMAGVGPFAVPAARRRVSVFANDLNPACAHYLAVNAVLNGVQPLLRAFNLDARAFLRALAGAGAAPGVAPAPFDVVVMNLPASAVEFLDAFAGAFGHPQWAGRPLPRVHCYAFLRDSETQDDLRRRAERALGGPVGHSWAVHVVRDVAPRKEMVCLSFTAPDWLRDPARATQARPDEAQEEGGGREGKRARVD